VRRFTPLEYVRACVKAAAVAPAFLRRPYRDASAYREYQTRRVARLIRYAYTRTPFYRNKYDEAGVTPDDFHELDDLARFPTTTKEELIEAIVAGTLGTQGGIESVSSGSSGKIITVTHRPSDTHAYAVGRFRILNMTGVLRPWDRTLYVYTSEFPARSLFGLYPSRFVSTLNDLRDSIRRIRALRPRVLCIYPSRLLEMAAMLDAPSASALGLALISVNSETSSPEQRSAMAEHFGCPVLEEYSTEELGWTATECAFHTLHIWEDMVRLETLDSDVDVATRPGDVGEIVGTNLHNFATPFIRYRQGDLGSIHDVTCECGRTFRALEHLVGRKNDAFHFDSGSVSPAYLLDSIYSLVLDHSLPIADFCLLQETRNRVTFQFASRRRDASPGLTQAIERHLAPLFPPGVTVRAHPTAQMYKTATGKRNPIVSLVSRRQPETDHEPARI